MTDSINLWLYTIDITKKNLFLWIKWNSEIILVNGGFFPQRQNSSFRVALLIICTQYAHLLAIGLLVQYSNVMLLSQSLHTIDMKTRGWFEGKINEKCSTFLCYATFTASVIEILNQKSEIDIVLYLSLQFLILSIFYVGKLKLLWNKTTTYDEQKCNVIAV